MKRTRNLTCKITDVGNFNQLVRTWFDADGEVSPSVNLEIGDIVNIKEYAAPEVPGGKYTEIQKALSSGVIISTTLMGLLIFDRTDSSYNMKNDRHRVQVTTNVK